MLVHICCSVDSHFFLQKLKQRYPKEELVGFFYDPNIHPYIEYQLRLLDVKRSCEMLGVKLIEGKYDYVSWLKSVKGFENEPEKGKRCSICFDKRVEESMKEALKLGEKKVTTTLLTSPKKSIEQLRNIGNTLAKKYGIEFISPDFRIKGGTQEQFALAKKEKLYHQDYCGCIYALGKQREAQSKIKDELFTQVNKQIVPNSLQYRLDLYQKRYKFEQEGKKYDIIREKFLNYRMLRGYLEVDKKVLPSYFLSYSYMKRKKEKLKIEKKIKNIFYSNRHEVKLIEISYLNKVLKTSFANTKELILSPVSFNDEAGVRKHIDNLFFGTSPIVVVDKVDFKNFEIYCDTILYQDVMENLVSF